MNDFITDVKYIWSVLRQDKRGVTAVEYGIMASLIAAGLVTAVGYLTTGLSHVFTRVGTTMVT